MGLVILCAIVLHTFIQPERVNASFTTPQIFAGSSYAFGLKSDGTLYGWGYNNSTSSCLGNGDKSTVLTPIQIISGVKDVFQANGTTFAVLEDGSIRMWGTNSLSQMGVGGDSIRGAKDKNGYGLPTQHPYITNVKKIIVSNESNHVFAILNNNSILYWGYNNYGQLGNGNTSTVFMPTTSSFTNVKDIAVGGSHTLVLKNDGTVYSTGYNATGQLGIGSTTNKSTLTLISSLAGVDRIYAGGTNSFAVKTDGTVYAWGSNGSGCLGGGSTGSKKAPILVPGLTNVVQISMVPSNVIVLMADGTVKTAGDNTYGQLGYNTNGADSANFNTVPGITNAIQVQAGRGFSMVLQSDGSVVMFGRNDFGMLGRGYVDTLSHPDPMAVPNLKLMVDRTPPVITIGAYNTNPTNQDITVMAATNKGTLNKTSHTFTENGSFEFIATDDSGNVTRKTVTITNIDKIAPIITVNAYITHPTNQDITVTASVNEGILNKASQIFSENGSFEFIATDGAGNISKKIVTITNIDKIHPSKPMITILNGKLVIASGTDGESGVKETLYQINSDEWRVYSEEVPLADGEYVINAKTVDLAGNESLYACYNTKVYNNALNEATAALVKAEDTYIQEDLDAARVLINALPDSPEKAELINRSDNLQKAIDDSNTTNVTAEIDEDPETQRINLLMRASNLKDLYTMQFEIHYDPEILEPDQIDIRNLAWENEPHGYTAFKTDSGAGVIYVIYSRTGNLQGVNGDSDLIRLPLKVIRNGNTTVEVSKIKLVNSQGKRMKTSAASITKDINIQSRFASPLKITLIGEKGPYGGYLLPLTVEITALDAKEIYYSVDSDTKYSYTQPFTISEVGQHTITAFAEDRAGNIITESISFVVYANTTLTLDVPPVEYSDLYTIRATLTTCGQTVSGTAISVSGATMSISGAAISIRLNGIDMGIHHTDSQGRVILEGITSLQAGAYPVEVKYLPDASEYYLSSQAQASLTVLAKKNSSRLEGRYKVYTLSKIFRNLLSGTRTKIKQG